MKLLEKKNHLLAEKCKKNKKKMSNHKLRIPAKKPGLTMPLVFNVLFYKKYSHNQS